MNAAMIVYAIFAGIIVVILLIIVVVSSATSITNRFRRRRIDKSEAPATHQSNRTGL